MQDCLILTGVQMPPASLRLMVIEPAGLAAFRTRPLSFGFMDQMNVNLSTVQLQLNTLNAPWGLNPQNLGIQFLVLHPPIMALPTQIPDEPKS